MTDADNPSGVNTQEVSLYDVDGVAIDSANPLPVQLQTTPTIDIGDVTLLAGEAHIGQVGGNSVVVSNNPVLTVAATYAANDYVGTSGVAMVFDNVARVNAGTGLITRVMLIDSALQSISGELWLFDTIVTPPSDSAPWSISDAHAALCIGVIPINTYYASALNSVAFGAPAAPMTFKCGAASKAIYGCFVTRGAPAYASLDLTFRLSVIQD